MAVHHLPASKQLSGPAIDGICDDLSFDPQVSMAFKMFQYVSILKSSNGTMENWGYRRKAPDGTSVKFSRQWTSEAAFLQIFPSFQNFLGDELFETVAYVADVAV